MDYIPHILPMTLEEVEAEIDRRNYEQWAYGRLFKGPDLWDLVETRKVRQAEAAKKAESK